LFNKNKKKVMLSVRNPKETNEVRSYFEPRAGGAVRIFGFYYNKQTIPEKKKRMHAICSPQTL